MGEGDGSSVHQKVGPLPHRSGEAGTRSPLYAGSMTLQPRQHTPLLLAPFVLLWRLFALIVSLTGRLLGLVLGLVMIGLGVLFTLTVIGAAIGIPLALLGGLLLTRSLF